MKLNTITTGILLLGIFGIFFSSIDDVFAGEEDIYIVNNLDYPLQFTEIKNKQNIKLITDPPKVIDSGKTESFTAEPNGNFDNIHLNIKYSVSTSDNSQDDQVGIVYKFKTGDMGDGSCPKDHPDWITEEVKHCGSFDNNKDWQYIFSQK